MIPVTKTFIPTIKEYSTWVEKSFNNRWITNRGALVLELESNLKKYLNIDNILITNNGTIPIQIALKLFGLGGEIITTPFSYVATTAAIVWEGCTPIFVDIHPDYLTIDENKIEAAITSKTTCILATHVFGNPCNTEVIDSIAKKYGLKVIYDAAHCFGVRYKDQSVFNFGDISTCSFHATKLFHTGEGGAAVIRSEELRHKFYYSHNFGHDGPLHFHGLGINAKISELQAAMGLAVLPHIEEILNARERINGWYDNLLQFGKIRKLVIRPNTEWNYSYYPIIFEHEAQLLIVQEKLNKANIFPRRYFYPSLDELPYVQSKEMQISRLISSTILCLPLYHDLSENDVAKISTIINTVLA